MSRAFKHITSCAVLMGVVMTAPNALAIDVANLPMLQNGDISISNEMVTPFNVQVRPQGCKQENLAIPPKSTQVVRCSGASDVEVVFHVLQSADGRLVERRQNLAVNNHYTLVWDEELKGYAKLGRLFDGSGRMIR